MRIKLLDILWKILSFLLSPFDTLHYIVRGWIIDWQAKIEPGLKPWEVLGLRPRASMGAVNICYRALKEVYKDNPTKLQEVEEAYNAIAVESA